VAQLVISPLQEGRINRHDRINPVDGQRSSKRDGVLFRNANVQALLREIPEALVEPRSSDHRRNDQFGFGVLTQDLMRAVAHEMAPRELTLVHIHRFSRLDVERRDAVPIADLVFFGQIVAFSFGGINVDDRRFGRVFSLFEGMIERGDVVTIDRADIGQTHVIEHRRGHQSRLDMALDPIGEIIEMMAGFCFVERPSIPSLDAIVTALGGNTAEKLPQTPDRTGNRHVVVVENDNNFLMPGPKIVEGLERKTIDDGGVTDDRNHVIVCAFFPTGDGEAFGRGKGGSTMTGFVTIVNRFGPILESAGITFLTKMFQRATGQDFVGVALVPNVEDQLIFREVKRAIQGNSQFDRSEVAGKMPSIQRGFEDDFFPNIIAQSA